MLQCENTELVLRRRLCKRKINRTIAGIMYTAAGGVRVLSFALQIEFAFDITTGGKLYSKA